MQEPQKFRLIEHTADIGLAARGRDLAEAFANVAQGLFSIIAGTDAIEERESRVVELQAADQEALLFDWINELIYLFEVESLLFKRCEVGELEGPKLRAVCYGERYDQSRHEIKLGVKSATYHMLKVDAETHEVQVILDI